MRRHPKRGVHLRRRLPWWCPRTMPPTTIVQGVSVEKPCTSSYLMSFLVRSVQREVRECAAGALSLTYTVSFLWTSTTREGLRSAVHAGACSMPPSCLVTPAPVAPCRCACGVAPGHADRAGHADRTTGTPLSAPLRSAGDRDARARARCLLHPNNNESSANRDALYTVTVARQPYSLATPLLLWGWGGVSRSLTGVGPLRARGILRLEGGASQRVASPHAARRTSGWPAAWRPRSPGCPRGGRGS